MVSHDSKFALAIIPFCRLSRLTDEFAMGLIQLSDQGVPNLASNQ
jgi:hypothetical protein